jgi:hypothetical protein
MFSQVDAEFGHKLSEGLSRYAWNSDSSFGFFGDAQNFVHDLLNLLNENEISI